jgi:hypothetical protein
MKTVTHKLFGKGTVISIDSKNVQVDFNGDVKILMLKFANLSNEDGSVFYVEPKKISKPKKTPLPKIDYSKYSDTELMNMYNDLMGDLMEAKSEARKDLRTGTR